MRTTAVEAVIAAATERFGAKSVATAPQDIAPWLTDWRGRYHGAAAAVLSPASLEEVAFLVALAARHRVPLVPQGGNTGMVGGATPPADGSALLLSLRRMNAIREIDAVAGFAVVEAGVVLQTLHETVAAQGMRFPLTLGARGSATVGGLVSTNAGGTQVLRFGTMRSLVAGVEAVMPDGGIWRGLEVLKKDNRGYDLNQLLIGAEGTLGVVTAATLKLVPAIGDRAVAWIGVETPEVALQLLRRFERQTRGVEGFEIVPADTLGLVLAHVPGTRSPLGGEHPWHVLVELVADREAVAELEPLVADAFEAGLIRDATIAASEAQAEAFWRLRDSISEAERAAGPAMQHDISVPVDAMPRFMVEAAATVEAAFPGTVASAFGHLGDGNVHFHVRAPAASDADSWRRDVGYAASGMVHDLVDAAGGSISAEHGIGQMKRDELARLSDPVRMATLRAIKHALDPLGIMNPGKLL
ncbi:FAD-binding oxidoreductase [Sphingomonas sp. SUN039]|nr:FAD-binding oxidoreductase [Sphingomonas sp. SUN039]UVO54625.1 FAD-binding oxidoreductase [Sphingomonas sp. SUN039]